MACFSDTPRHRIEHLEGRHDFTGPKHFDAQTAAGGLIHSPCKVFRCGAQSWQPLWPSRHQLPFDHLAGANRGGDANGGRIGPLQGP